MSKRLLTTLLAFALIFTQIPAVGLSEGAEVIETQPEETPEPATTTGAEGLTIEIGDLSDDADADADADRGNVAGDADGDADGQTVDDANVDPDNGDARYAKVTAARAELRQTPEAEAFAALSEGGTVLVLGRDGGWVKVAFYSERGTVEAYASAEDLTMLDDEQIGAFMDAVAEAGLTVLYNDDLDSPLANLSCEFFDAAQTDSAADDGGAESNEVTEDAVETEEASESLEANDAAINFALSAYDLQLCVEEKQTITATKTTGALIAINKLTFTSSDPDVAAVSASGEITAKKSGSAEITVTYNNQSLLCSVTVPQEPTSIKLNTSSGAIGLGESYKGLKVIFNPSGSASKVTWYSSNTKYIAVDEDTGEIIGKKTGSATITAKTRNGKLASCKITVKKKPTSIKVSPTSMKLGYGGATGQLTLKLSSGSACGDVRFTSSDESVATVDENGVVTSVNGGTATITATTFNKLKATCTVTVYAEPAAVRFKADEMTVGIGESIELGATPLDSKGGETVAALTYTVDDASLNPNCVSVDASKGTVKGVSSGQAIIRATAANGAMGVCAVNVVALPTAIQLSASTASVGVGEKYNLVTATLVPPKGEETCSAEITWSSAKTKIATVDAKTGEIKGVKTGTTTITAKTSNGKKATCKVTVKKAPTKLTLSPTTAELAEGGDTQKLSVSIPAGTAYTCFTYTSTNPDVASVDGKGTITSGKAGKATVTVSTHNTSVKASCVVTVYGEPGKVALDRDNIAIGIGDTASIVATATTANGGATKTTLTYYIDDASPNPDCIKIDAATGKITALKKGTAYVNAMTGNGISAWFPCTVTVQPRAIALTIPATLTMGAGLSHPALEGTLTFQDNTTTAATGLTWTSGSKSIVTVDKTSGILTAKTKGTATITAETTGGLKASCKVTVAKAPDRVTISPDTVKLSEGGMHFQLSAAVTEGAYYDVTFTSSNPSVATVDASGLVTSVGVGEATITATSYNGVTGTCIVTVTGTPAKARFADTEVTIGADESVIPDVLVQASDGSEVEADLNFRILSGAQFIQLDSTTGEITAVEAGTSFIGVTTHNGISASNTCKVTVIAVPTGIKLNTSSISLGMTETAKLNATVEAIGGADTTVTWTSSNPKAVIVDKGGELTALAEGTSIITAETVNHIIATCTVKVGKIPTSITISPANSTIGVDETTEYKVKLSSGSSGEVTFESSDPAIAQIDDNGVARGIAVGEVTITATTYNGLTAKATLTVKEAAKAAEDDPANNALIEKVIAAAESQLNKPYVYGGGYSARSKSPSGFDCSGLVYWSFMQVGIKLKDSAYKQGYDNTYAKITSISALKRGDVVCFNTSDDSDLSDHTSIYLGGGKFIHASSSGKKVMISDLSSGYYYRNFSWGRRIIG